MDRLDTLLTKIVNNEPIDDWECLNRLEQYLVCILTKTGIEALGEPMNRLEVLLQALYENVPEASVKILAAKLVEIDENR
jgi:hypothetical protein